MTKSFIARHNEAGRMILKAIKNGPIGNHYMIADIGTEEHMTDLGVQDMRLPDWLAKPEIIEKLNAISTTEEWKDRKDTCEGWSRMDPTDRLKLRPDIMIVNVTNQEAASLHQGPKMSNKRTRSGVQIPILRDSPIYEIKIIEIGYSSDTRYIEKLQEKEQQHAQLCRILREEGHKVDFIPIILGTQGSVFRCSTKAFESLGMPAQSSTNSVGAYCTIRNFSCFHSRGTIT